VSLEFLDRMRGGLTPVYSRGMETLTLAFGATAADGITAIAGYDFGSYQSLYDGMLPPSPRYLLAPQVTVTDPVTVRFWFTRGPASPEDPPVDIQLPAGWPAGRTVAVPIPGGAADITSRLRLTRLQPQPPASQAAQDWEVVALLGNLAKLLWVIGVEHEELAAQLADVASQRNADAAHDASLDLLGSDLGAPRFPPTPYTFDPDTIALYHLDDLPVPPASEVTTVIDDRSRYQPASHPGQNNGGNSGRPGRFAGAFAFTQAQSSISVPDSPDFALAAGAPFTVEAIIKPDPTTTATGAVIAKRSPLNTSAAAGWALTVGSFRGIDHNLRFSLCDGASEAELFADLDLADGVFHHVAGVVDNRQGPPATVVALVYVDGVEVARQQLDPLGSVSSADPILIGYGQESVGGNPADAQYVGLVDEVRISKIARSSFNPVIGEGDDHYRRRLRVFQGWLLPSRGALEAALNQMAGPVAGDPSPFIVAEAPDPLVMGTLALRVLPAPLAPGQGIDAGGNQRTTEAAAVGVAADEPDFDVAWLGRHPDQAGLDFSGADSHRLMQWSVRQALDALLERLGSAAGTLHVLQAYDPGPGDLYSVGRALLLAHDTVAAADLAVLAHAAGFGWVATTGTGQVHVAQPRADIFRITPLEPGTIPPPPDVTEGQDLVLGADPDQASFADSEITWSVVRTGSGTATLTPENPPTLHAGAAGDVSVHVEVTRRNHTRGGSRDIRIGLAAGSLAAGGSIGGDGLRGVTEAAAAGAPTTDFSDLYLELRTDDYPGQGARVSYGADLANRRMQRVTSAALDRLLALLAAAPGTLTVVKAYDPAATGLLTQGRALWLSHSSLAAAELAAAAFAAAFDYIRIDPGPPETVQVAIGAGEQIGVTGPDEVQVAQSVAAAVLPSAQPSAVCFSADGSRGYISDSGNHRVTSFTMTADPAGAFPQLALDQSGIVPATPGAISFAGSSVYVAQELPGVISVLDPVTLAPGPAIATGAQPVAMAADGTAVFVGCAGDSTLREYDAGTQQQVASLVLPGVPRSVTPVPGGASLYVVIDGDRLCQVNRAGLQLAGPPVATGAGAVSAAVTPDGTKLYVACTADDPGNGTGTVRVYSTASNQQSAVITGFPAGTPPAALAISADQRDLYVATSGSSAAPGRVHVADAATDTLLPQVFAPGATAAWLATSPAAAAYQPCLVAVSAEAATVTLGDPAPLRLAAPEPPVLVASVALGSGAGEEPGWSTIPFSRGQVALSSYVKPAVQLTGGAPGAALVRALYIRGDDLRPYEFEVRLNQNLDPQPGVTITKDQYDVVMNVLNWFHPIGVEVRTARLRAHVVELSGLNADLFPGYTYPVYRNTGLVPPNPINPTTQG
jgi:Concanavalin A-like lectin/glucanases superfamily